MGKAAKRYPAGRQRHYGCLGKACRPSCMANHELRTLRRTAHHYFDQLYESGYMSKQDAYQWLADLIIAPLSEAHIGHLGEYYCKQVIEESRKLLERRKAKTRGRYYAQKGGALAS